MLDIIIIFVPFVGNNQHETKKPIVFPAQLKLMQQGENLRLALKGRELTSLQFIERAAINRPTLVEIEKGIPGISMGALF